jgi:hypothetical protein
VSDNNQEKGTDLLNAIIDMKSKVVGNQNRSREEFEDRHRAILFTSKEQARFVEPYLKLDSWFLFSIAIPVCLGYPVDKINLARMTVDYKDAENQVRAALGVSLKLINPEEKEDQWRVDPKLFVKWMVEKRIGALKAIQNYLLEDPEVRNLAVSSTQSERHSAKREQIYIAAISILVNFPDQCIGKGNKISATEIARVMEEKSPLWFGDEEPPLSSRVIKDVISKAINTAKK